MEVSDFCKEKKPEAGLCSMRGILAWIKIEGRQGRFMPMDLVEVKSGRLQR
ncbi:hypothetical protein [Geoalkalibacter halelectricus]|uniref:hypothetical protein n=1 Tax=Geoalkalibacter halelectricus TaxID=2847045 RepID=UPI00266E93CA|nr:hypothetical protein [Geoalkalibacter halelectricus]